MIDKVIVVFKTHLDIGYTDLAETVLKNYRESFIPKAVELAMKTNTGQKKRFVWTVGSYLIFHYLESPDVPKEQKERLENLLRLGWIRWHGLACVSETGAIPEMSCVKIAGFSIININKTAAGRNNFIVYPPKNA